MNQSETAEDYEKRHVHQVYESVAEEFSDTHYRVWPSVKLFLDNGADPNIPSSTGYTPFHYSLNILL